MRNDLVTVVIPVFNEERHIEQCLDAVAAQTYTKIVEVLVIDGGSTDRTREIVTGRAGIVRLVDNPRRIQAAALNIGLAEARGALVVRVDGHCVIAPDYVQNCVVALSKTGAAMVGGAITPLAHGWLQCGIAAAMGSSFGAGPARFHVGGEPGWVDTVYLGAYDTEQARQVGGYAEDVGVNEDAEFAIRMGRRGGVWFDPSIRSTYTPRSSLKGVARQFYRYGRSRAATVRRHPGSLSPRQLAAPLLVAGLLTPWRKPLLAAYGAAVLGVGTRQATRDAKAAPGMILALPAMHVPWGIGFLQGLFATTALAPPGDAPVAASSIQTAAA